MSRKPDDYEATQESWSKGGSKGIESAARDRVKQAVRCLRANEIEIKSVCVIGPQHGFELSQWAKCTEVVNVFGIDPVKSFCDDAKDIGFDCYQCCIEDMDSKSIKWMNAGSVGFYTSHSLEHCYDIEKAVANIKEIGNWCFACVPIEMDGVSDDKAHLSVFSHRAKLPRLFEPWKMVWDYYKESKDHPPGHPGGRADARYLFVK